MGIRCLRFWEEGACELRAKGVDSNRYAARRCAQSNSSVERTPILQCVSTCKFQLQRRNARELRAHAAGRSLSIFTRRLRPAPSKEKELVSLVQATAGPLGRRDMAKAMSAVEKAQCREWRSYRERHYEPRPRLVRSLLMKGKGGGTHEQCQPEFLTSHAYDEFVVGPN